MSKKKKKKPAKQRGPDEEAPGPGWAAIDEALRALHGADEPAFHYAPVPPAGAGGDHPLTGISVYEATRPGPHWHFVTYGFTELFEKETSDPEISGFGFELTLGVDGLVLRLDSELARTIADRLRPVRGEHRFDALPGLVLEVVPTEVTGPGGEVLQVVG